MCPSVSPDQTMLERVVLAPRPAPPSRAGVDHHITEENMLISEIYADTQDWSVLASAGRRRKSYDRSGLEVEDNNDDDDPCDVLQTKPTSSPLITSHLAYIVHTSQLVINRRKRESRNIPITSDWFPHHPGVETGDCSQRNYKPACCLSVAAELTI